MAQPSTELNTFRNRATNLLDSLGQLDNALAIVKGAGDTDQERLAFFQQYIDSQPGYDITVTELQTAVVQLRNLKTWLETNLPDLAKMRI